MIGAVVGALFAYALASGNPDGVIRRVVTSACGVLSQFGGVTLAFAFIATIGGAGFITLWLQEHGINIYANGVWLYQLSGLVLVYTYFQIPLMVIVFLPALDGIRPQWREATANLGGNSWHYWRHVAGPLLMPAFLGPCLLLLFANAFSAYATAAALINQGGIIVPLQEISNALSSEVGLAQANLASWLALLDGGDRRWCDRPLFMAAAPHRSAASVNRRKHRRLQIFRSVVLVGLGIFFLVPIGAMIEFSTRGVGINAPRTLSSFTGRSLRTQDLTGAIWASLELAVITSVAMLVLLLPTMVWVRLRVPAQVEVILRFSALRRSPSPRSCSSSDLRRCINGSTSISAIRYSRWGSHISSSCCPTRIARSMGGASRVSMCAHSQKLGAALERDGPPVVWRIIVPNMSSAVLNACLLSVAVVLGEFTIANLLNFENLQVAIALIGRANAGVSIAVAVASLLFVFVLLLALSFVPRPGSRRRRVEVA